MSAKPNSDRQIRRRKQTQAEIVAVAWEIVRSEGLAGLSLRDLGARVGMRAQSLYSYFASKHEIYDAMFHQGYEAFAEWVEDPTGDQEVAGDPAAIARRVAHRFVDFCTSDPARYQLLFQRTVPGFEPSPESWAVALDAYDRSQQRLAVVGVDDQETLDLWTATLTGLASQQISNDPGGDRWEQLIDRAVDMLLADVRTHSKSESRTR